MPVDAVVCGIGGAFGAFVLPEVGRGGRSGILNQRDKIPDREVRNQIGEIAGVVANFVRGLHSYKLNFQGLRAGNCCLEAYEKEFFGNRFLKGNTFK